ncbi:hypothetical protein QQ045_022275 [Rhodiola kirilowii]
MKVLARRLNRLGADRSFGFHPRCKKTALTHLMFAADVLILARANNSSILTVKKALDDFFVWSGLQVNLEKSNIYFGGVSRSHGLLLAANTGFNIGEMPFNYLGIPLDSHSLRKSNFDKIVTKMTSKISSLTARKFYYAGRMVLIKHV